MSRQTMRRPALRRQRHRHRPAPSAGTQTARRGLSMTMCLLTLLVILVFCVSGTAASEVRIGIALPLSGDMAEIGASAVDAVRLAAETVPFQVRPRIVFADTAADPATAREAAERLLDREKAAVLLGGMASPAAWVLARIAHSRQVPLVIPTASADALTQQGWNTVFRIALPVSEQRSATSGFLEKAVTGIRTAAILHDRSELATHRVETLMTLWRSLELETVLVSGSPAGAVDFRPLLAKAKVAAPDLLYLVFGPADAPAILQQALELRLRPRIVFGEPAGFSSPELEITAGRAVDRLCVPVQWAPNAPYPGASRFAEAFRARFGRNPDYRAAQVYTGMQVLADALRRAGSGTPARLRRALTQTRLSTVYGKVAFASSGGYGQQNLPRMLMLQWQRGRPEIVWPGDIATARLSVR